MKIDRKKRLENSRNGLIEKIDGVSWRKFCEICGNEFITCCQSRKRCTKCVCKSIGIKYRSKKLREYNKIMDPKNNISEGDYNEPSLQ